MFKVTAHEAKTISWWYSRKAQIDFNPPYQRKGDRWPLDYKQYLIDSIINEFDIPKIYLADFTLLNSELNTANLAYAIIDGRQRLESIFGFMENQFPLAKDFRYLREDGLNLRGLHYKDIVGSYPSIASIFTEFNLHVMSVVTDQEDMINNLFIRLNRSEKLTGSELRNAMSGPVVDGIRSLCGNPFFSDRIRFSTKKGEDQNTVAKLLLIESKGRMVDTKKTQLDALVKESAGDEEEIAKVEGRVAGVLSDMNKVFVSRDTLLTAQGSVPIYYWLVRELGYRNDLRKFFVDFEDELVVNNKKVKEGESDTDSELSHFAILKRSTNDQKSLEGRYEILKRRYQSQ